MVTLKTRVASRGLVRVTGRQHASDKAAIAAEPFRGRQQEREGGRGGWGGEIRVRVKGCDRVSWSMVENFRG